MTTSLPTPKRTDVRGGPGRPPRDRKLGTLTGGGFHTGSRGLGRAGVTIIELLTVIVVIGILANVALPLYRNVTERADAAKITSDYHAVKVAAFSYFSQHNTFPPSGSAGTVPPELVPFLPEGFRFTYGDATYRWHRWALPSGAPGGGTQQWILGFTVASPNPFILRALENQFQGTITQATGGQLTMIMD